MAASLPAPTALSPRETDELAQESSLHASLARLQEMHITLRHLRDTIPRVITPLQSADTTPAPTPTDLYAQFAHAATTAGKDIKGFMGMMRDERAREVFERVRQSREVSGGEGVEGWRVTEFEGWADVDGGQKGEVGGFDDWGERERGKGKGEGESWEDVVRGFQGGHPGVEVLIGGVDGVRVKLPAPANLNFVAVESNSAGLQEEWGVATNAQGSEELWKISGVTNSSMKETKFTNSIQDAIDDSEYKFTDLRSILEMVASYSDVTTKPCGRCSRLVDRTGQLPIIRNRKFSKENDARSTTQWLAFHKACR